MQVEIELQSNILTEKDRFEIRNGLFYNTIHRQLKSHPVNDFILINL